MQSSPSHLGSSRSTSVHWLGQKWKTTQLGLVWSVSLLFGVKGKHPCAAQDLVSSILLPSILFSPQDKMWPIDHNYLT